MSGTDTTGRRFLDLSAHYLREDYLHRIEGCLARLSEDDVWYRPNEASNSIGNLVLHLSGNVRQWIVAGVGGAHDTRQRQQEFDERGPVPVAELLDRLRDTIGEAANLIVGFPAEHLDEARRIQGYDTTVFGAIYHVVEHFSMHTGQIILLTKARTGADLGFYRTDAAGVAKPTWPRRL